MNIPSASSAPSSIYADASDSASQSAASQNEFQPAGDSVDSTRDRFDDILRTAEGKGGGTIECPEGTKPEVKRDGRKVVVVCKEEPKTGPSGSPVLE